MKRLLLSIVLLLALPLLVLAKDDKPPKVDPGATPPDKVKIEKAMKASDWKKLGTAHDEKLKKIDYSSHEKKKKGIVELHGLSMDDYRGMTAR